MTFNTYRKKPVEIQAVHFNGTHEHALEIVGIIGADASVLIRPESGTYILISTLEGVMEAQPGDWIIKGIQGEFYPCKPDIFENSYDKV